MTIMLFGLLMRTCVGLHGYSGKHSPPMYGDFEAQRHWMELTLHLPIGEWYSYDLQYWGLDYPPLTAYVSYFFAFLANVLQPEWVALDTSRGVETIESVAFMRATVLLCDVLIFFPSMWVSCVFLFFYV